MADEDHKTEVPPPCPVVGIGASAGGVAALQGFFEALPPDAREMAFVVVVHLDPTHQSELATILAARTSLPVQQVNRRMSLHPGCVYVIGPDRRLQIDDHEISSKSFDEPRGQRAPIDLFFRSLAEQRGDGFAVVLTGAGSDGAVGVRAVKEAGGIILVQEPNEAEYPSMPRSAIATGVVDFVLPVREIAARLGPLLRSKQQLKSETLASSDEEVLRRLLAHLRARTGHDFSKYKRSTVLRRVARRMQVHRIEPLEEYLAYARDNVEEMQALFADLLISVTTFFRDPRAWEVLARKAIPMLFEGKADLDHMRVWVPGCATGEEAYSLAILILEEAARREVRPQLHIFASDLDAGALATAREGRYPAAIAADVSEERLRRYFEHEGDHYRIRREVRDVLLFATHSLLKDPPFSRLDMISCRNLLIYLDRELQQQACSTFAYALNPGGILFLGSSENADTPPGLFQSVNREARIFRSADKTGRQLSLPRLLDSNIFNRATDLPRPVQQPAGPGDPALHWRALEEAAPPSVLVNENHGLVHLSDNAGRYLRHPGGPLSSDITELARPELRVHLRAALNRALEQDQNVISLPVAVRFDGTLRQIYMQVRPVRREGGPRQALVLFIEGEEITPEQEAKNADKTSGGEADVVRQLQDELQATRARLRTNMEEYEAANEELRAANEELQSIGEEYRSTAEELETSKEELQSVNEELQTVNSELKSKLEGVSRAHSDLQNLIGATDVGTLFLDAALRIKRFTPRVSDLFNITASDEGRPITDFTHRLKYDGLAQDAQRILTELGAMEHEVESQVGRWYLMRVRPYRTVHDKIDGVVVTFVDVTARRQTEADLRESETRLQLAREAASLGVIDYNTLADQMWWDEGARRLWGLRTEATADIEAFWHGIHLDDAKKVRKSIDDALNPNTGGNIDCEFRVRARGEPERWVRLSGKAFFESVDGKRKPVRLVGTVQDITDRKQWEINQRLLLGELSHRVKNVLSIVQAMARQSLRGKAEDAAVQNFESRLRALSGAHDLLTASEWKGAGLRELVERQMSAHLGNGAEQIKMSGPAVNLSPSLATSFGLLIHELATNALKYGALSAGRGSVDLSWSVSSPNGKPILHFRWQEKDGPRVSKPTGEGFGTFLIQHGMPAASVKREFAPSGLVCAIELPLEGTSSTD